MGIWDVVILFLLFIFILFLVLIPFLPIIIPLYFLWKTEESYIKRPRKRKNH